MSAGITIEGLQAAQQANEKMIAAMRPSGALGRGIVYATTQMHRSSVYNTPWDTGGLRAAHRMKVDGLRGMVFIGSGANPAQGGAAPSEYGPILHAQGMRPGLRGGIRAFYAYTVETDGPKVARDALGIIKGGLP
jgi:hypothetical protein